MRFRERVCAEDGAEVLSQLAEAVQRGDDLSLNYPDFDPERVARMLERLTGDDGKIDPGRIDPHENLGSFGFDSITLKALDKALQALNSDYEAKRYKNITLNPLRLHQAREGLFYDWLKSKGKLGGQHKVPRLSNTREYLEELLELNQRVTTG